MLSLFSDDVHGPTWRDSMERIQISPEYTSPICHILHKSAFVISASSVSMQISFKAVAICADRPAGDVCLLEINCGTLYQHVQQRRFSSVRQHKVQHKQARAARETAVLAQASTCEASVC